jgi:16S rRNA A1518/A1519 N6-dimethyltransferase RsmA/KsgA/DIM1 with predicted DNA glycosylase/AP lyase activity
MNFKIDNLDFIRIQLYLLIIPIIVSNLPYYICLPILLISLCEYYLKDIMQEICGQIILQYSEM